MAGTGASRLHVVNIAELARLQFKYLPPFENRTCRLKRLEAYSPMLVGLWGLGIDPGRNFGACSIQDGSLQLWWGTLPKESQLFRYGVSSYNITRELFANLRTEGHPAIIEGASYHSKYGQVGLAECRFGFYLGFVHCGRQAEIVPPATIRRIAFGSGKQTGFDLFPALNTNAADAIGCALTSAGWRR